MNIGDLARLSTPDDADGKVVLITGTVNEGVLTGSYIAIIVGETEKHVYLQKELKLLDD
jgi:hypothetical protein